MRQALIRAADASERVVAVALTFLMASMVVLGFYQVVTRFVLHEASPWTEEVLRRTMIWMVALGLSIGFRHGAHICVDVINRVEAALVRSVARTAVFLVTVTFLLALVWLGGDMAWRVRFQTFGSLELSMTWAYLAIPVGAALSVLSLLARFAADAQGAAAGADLDYGGLQCQE